MPEIKNASEVTKLEKLGDGNIAITCHDQTYVGRSVILCPGSNYRKLGIPGRGRIPQRRGGRQLLWHLRRPLLPRPRGDLRRWGKYSRRGGPAPGQVRGQGYCPSPPGRVPRRQDPRRRTRRQGQRVQFESRHQVQHGRHGHRKARARSSRPGSRTSRPDKKKTIHAMASSSSSAWSPIPISSKASSN